MIKLKDGTRIITSWEEFERYESEIDESDIWTFEEALDNFGRDRDLAIEFLEDTNQLDIYRDYVKSKGFKRAIPFRELFPNGIEVDD